MTKRPAALLWTEMPPLKVGAVILAKHCSPDLAKHLQVLRIQKDENINLLDGKGTVLTLRCADQSQTNFEVVACETKTALLPDIELCLAAPKSDALWQSVQQATEIGIGSIQLINADYLQHSKSSRDDNSIFDRMQRIADAATEQCARPWQMQIQKNWQNIDVVLGLHPNPHVNPPSKPDRINIVADERLSSLDEIGFHDIAPRLDLNSKLRLFIGPEGGWSEREHALFNHNCAKLGLGALVLRVPTAIVAATHFLRVVAQHGQK